MNGLTWADVNDRVLAAPKHGDVEVWELHLEACIYANQAQKALEDYWATKTTLITSVVSTKAGSTSRSSTTRSIPTSTR